MQHLQHMHEQGNDAVVEIVGNGENARFYFGEESLHVFIVKG